MLSVLSADVSRLDAGIRSLPLSQYRLEKLNRTTNEKAYRQSLGAELLLLRLLQELCPALSAPLDIVAGEDGKPELRGRELYFSLSHSGDRAVCAVSDSPVGVDIQKAEPFHEALSRRFFTAGEHAALLAADDRDYAFTRLWCLKESYLKYLGTGLSKPLASFELSLDGSGAPVHPGDDSCRLWHMADSGYHLAVCSAADEKEMICKQAEPL